MADDEFIPGLRVPVDTSQDHPIITLGGEQIHCVETIAPGAFLDLAAADESNFAAMAAAFQRFLFAIVEEGEEPTLEMLLFRKRDPIDVEDLRTIIEELSTWYGSRPTRRRGGTQSGPSATTGGSTDASPSPGNASPSPEPTSEPSEAQRKFVDLAGQTVTYGQPSTSGGS